MNDDQSPGRLLAFLAVSMAILMLWQSLFPPPRPPVPPAADTVATEEAPEKDHLGQAPEAMTAKPTPSPTASPSPSPSPGSAKVKPAEKRYVLESDKLRVEFSSHGARIVALQLRDYQEPGTDPKRPVIDLVPDDSQYFGALRVDELITQTTKVDPDAPPAGPTSPGTPVARKESVAGLGPTMAYELISKSKDQLVFRVELPQGQLLSRTWLLKGQSLHHSLEVGSAHNDGELLVTTIFEAANPVDSGGGFLFGTMPDLARGLCRGPEEVKAPFLADVADAETVDLVADPSIWAGIDRNYFGAFWLPSGVTASSNRLRSCQIKRNALAQGDDDDAQTGRIYVETGERLSWSQSELIDGTLYKPAKAGAELLVIPKSEKLLKASHPTLIDTIDFGIFKFIAAPMLWLLNWLFGLVGNYGLAIILLTVIVKGLLFPITDMSYRSMAKMKEIQPELTKLREKYAADKQMQAQKQMELFREKGVNPAGGCLPMLLQIPVWFALYSTLRVAVELYGSPFISGWIDDLTLADPFYVMPLLLGVLFFFQQKLQPQAMDNPTQQMVMKIMPVMMTVFMIALPSGLVLYILFNTILGIAHQYYAIRRDRKPEPEPA